MRLGRRYLSQDPIPFFLLPVVCRLFEVVRTHVVVSFILIPSGFLFLGGEGGLWTNSFGIYIAFHSFFFSSSVSSSFTFWLWPQRGLSSVAFRVFFFSSVLSSNAMYTDFPYVFFFWFLWFFFFFISFVKPRVVLALRM